MRSVCSMVAMQSCLSSVSHAEFWCFFAKTLAVLASCKTLAITPIPDRITPHEGKRTRLYKMVTRAKNTDQRNPSASSAPSPITKAESPTIAARTASPPGTNISEFSSRRSRQTHAAGIIPNRSVIPNVPAASNAGRKSVGSVAACAEIRISRRLRTATTRHTG